VRDSRSLCDKLLRAACAVCTVEHTDAIMRNTFCSPTSDRINLRGDTHDYRLRPTSRSRGCVAASCDRRDAETTELAKRGDALAAAESRANRARRHGYLGGLVCDPWGAHFYRHVPAQGAWRKQNKGVCTLSMIFSASISNDIEVESFSKTLRKPLPNRPCIISEISAGIFFPARVAMQIFLWMT